MARFADRFRRGEPTPERAAARAPASLLSVEPEFEPEPMPEQIEMAAEAPRAEPAADTRPALLRKLAGDDAPPKRRFGRLSARKGDDTILAASPQRSRISKPRIGDWMARLTGEGAPREAPPRDDIDADAFEDIRRQIDGADTQPDVELHDAGKRLTLALSKAGWLAEEIAKCNAALDDARRLIRDEELKLARLRGLHEGIGGQVEGGQADLDTIQETLESLRRMVDRLDEPRAR
ncbi:MAG: hypothetical protein IBJ07_19245 [Rhizobiaceae bacterium]|nr:hypothetical protein [Rhizobiaceae bacterium]